MSLEQITTELLVFFLIYGGAAMAAFIACIYLLLRMGQSVTVWMRDTDA